MKLDTSKTVQLLNAFLRPCIRTKGADGLTMHTMTMTYRNNELLIISQSINQY
jgi:hypothetical protein